MRSRFPWPTGNRYPPETAANHLHVNEAGNRARGGAAEAVETGAGAGADPAVIAASFHSQHSPYAALASLRSYAVLRASCSV